MSISDDDDYRRLIERERQLYAALARLTAAVRETGARPSRAIYKPILAEAMAQADGALEDDGDGWYPCDPGDITRIDNPATDFMPKPRGRAER